VRNTQAELLSRDAEKLLGAQEACGARLGRSLL